MALGEGQVADGADDNVSERALARQLATLVHSAFAPTTPADRAPAVAWSNELARLGFDWPLVLTHDWGRVVLGDEPAPIVGAARAAAPIDAAVIAYHALVAALAALPKPERLSERAARPPLVAALLARAWPDGPRAALASTPLLLPSTSGAIDVDPGALAVRFDPSWALAWLRRAADARDTLVDRFEIIDRGLARLFAYLPSGGSSPDVASLYALAGDRGARAALSLSLDLLPSLLETKRASGAQRFAVGGYASIEPRGPVDTLLPSELAHDDDVFTRKALCGELLHHAHERPSPRVPPEHLILVDATASMRGLRQVLARGLALALGKRLALEEGGRGVGVRLFDSRLHPFVPIAAALAADLPYILGHRAERGRNLARVFDDLAHDLERRRRAGASSLAVTLITHGACHVPRALMERVTGFARVFAVFLLPDEPVDDLAYLPLLTGHRVLSLDALVQRDTRRARALGIVDAAARAAAPGRAPARTPRAG